MISEYFFNFRPDNADDSALAQAYLNDELDLARERRITVKHVDDTTYVYNTPRPMPSCWRCTIKHLGSADVCFKEAEKYPQRFVTAVGDLQHAYLECPDKDIAELIYKTYNEVLNTKLVPDLSDLMLKACERYQADQTL